LHFETNSELNTVFANDLGFTDFETNQGRPLDCSEKPGDTNIKDTTRITCFLYYGDESTKKRAVIEIPVEKAITAGTALEFYIAKVKNPAIASLRSNVMLQATRKCRVDDARCPVEISHAYYTT
jgi:hypothetical protein